MYKSQYDKVRKYRKKRIGLITTQNVIVLTIIIAVFVSVGYSYWNSTLTISGTVRAYKEPDHNAEETIIGDNGGSGSIIGDVEEGGTTYSGVSTAAETGLYTTTDPFSSNGGTMYFYRGNVTSNYFSFANLTWRILRINSDGSLRLILDNVAKTTTTGNTNATAKYATSNTPATNTIDSAISRITWESSPVYTSLNSWYTRQITSVYSDYVLDSKYVFDTSYNYTNSNAGGGRCYYFGPYTRVGRDEASKAPTFGAGTSATSGSSRVITAKVGLITADEIAYAGGAWNTNNTSYFLYNSAITIDTWTMSPSFWDDASHHKIGMIILGSRGQMHDWPSNGNTLTSSLGFRPVITVRGDRNITGTGTAGDPYHYVD